MDFSQPGTASHLWNQVIEYWGHRDRPSGQRFLGSARLTNRSKELLLDWVKNSLTHVRPLTFAQMEKQFGNHDPDSNWIKLIILALSEYAYYDDGDCGFWEGVCDRLGIPHQQGTVKALKEALWKGVKLLGLVKARKRNRFVSTLWLQSGIPQQNLEHFAQLLKEISQEYDWWDIAHADPEDLAQLMYDACQQRHPQWGKLLNFLNSSCSEDDQTAEPVSGKLLQGIAVVAQELERRSQSPEILRDSAQREQLLQNYYLPNNFFLRNWDNLIQILTPQTKAHAGRHSIVGQRKKPLSLMLDVANSMEIQLALPAQTLWQSNWNSQRGTYCQIQEIGWESILPNIGTLEIPELTQTIEQANEAWAWQLRSHNHTTLTEWRCEGIVNHLPILIFDAWTGEQLSLKGIRGRTEIICFRPKGTKLEIDSNVEQLDPFVPCSIPAWQGQHLQLTGTEAHLIFHCGEQTHAVQWNQLQTESLQLRGLKLCNKEPTYLEIPSVWHPPLALKKSLNVLVEDLTNRALLTQPDESITLAANSSWQKISLSQWITRSGSYNVRLWNQTDSWSEQFKVQSDFELTQPPNPILVEACDCIGSVIPLPVRHSNSTAFWLEEITLRGLWALEDVKLLLTNGQETQSYIRQANSTGCVTLCLASLRDALPESEWYALSYQRQGEEPQQLIEVSAGDRSISYTWTNQAIHFSGLQLEQEYTLTLWNLLLPQSSIQQEVFRTHNLDATTIPLDHFFGIFYAQLESPNCLTQSLGWWSGIHQLANLQLPIEIDDEQFDYCNNLFENDSAEAFLAKAQKLKLDLDCQQLKQAIDSLDKQPCHLPNWLDRALLKQKLQVLIPSEASKKKISEPPPQKKISTYQVKLQSNTPVIRRAFDNRFKSELKKVHLEQSILQIKDPILKDLIRVELKDQECLPKLKEILLKIESAIHIPITLMEWC
jgi:hypothetical protein